MAIDTARINLERASARSPLTAPFHNTTDLKRKHAEATASPNASAEPPVAPQVMVHVPLAASAPLVETPSRKLPNADRPSAARPPWIAFIAAIVAVAVTVWWIMLQRLPDIERREAIQRNLSNARLSMADGPYTGPEERSALHYYNSVLALDPSNADAIAGIDAIADRHITNARVLMAEQRIAEAGIALEKARRVRPNHIGLAVLDTQLRIELRRMLAASTAATSAAADASAKPVDAPAKPLPAKATTKTFRARLPRRNSEPVRLQEITLPAAAAVAPKSMTNPPPAPLPVTLDEAALERIAIAKAAKAAQAPAATNSAVAETAASDDSSPGRGASVDKSVAATAAPSSLQQRGPEPVVRAAAPKLIKMVQPKYPQEALMRGIEGWVDISLRVTAAGDVIEPRIEESSRGRVFNRAALAAVLQWKYEPRRDGAPTEQMRVRVRFQQSN